MKEGTTNQPATEETEVVAAATETAIASAAENNEAPSDKADASVLDELTLEELRHLADTGEMPARLTAAAADKKDASADPKAAAAPEKPAEPADDALDAAAVPEFEFTEDADKETFEAQAAEYLEMVEITPQMQRILDHYKTEAAQVGEQLSTLTALGEIETTQKTMNAFNRMAIEYRQDPDTGQLVPDTTEALKLLQSDYQKEFPYLMVDALSLPSAKYQGSTLMEELIYDQFELNETAMQHLDNFLSNKGRIPIPSYLPENIREAVGEAFWTSPDRERIQEQLKRWNDDLRDPHATEEDKNRARLEIQNINEKLHREQQGLNAIRASKEAATRQANEQREQITQTAENSYRETCVGLVRNLSSTVERALTMIEGDGAGVAALGIVTLVEKALTDDDWSRYAQEDLNKKGINFDWKRGRAALDRLYEIEGKIAHLETGKHNPRAIEAAKRTKSDIIKELQGLERELVGKITNKVVTGSNKALQTKIKNAPRIPAVRPKAGNGAANGDGVKPKSNFDEMSKEELRKYLAEKDNAYRRALGGDLSGFQ